MLHIITENNELRHRVFPIPDGVRKILQQTFDSYDGDKTIEGYKRLKNLLGSKTITYQDMKRIKNFFDNYGGSDKSAEYILNGGEPMMVWVNNTLNTATKAVRDFKQAKKDAGISNAFIKHHTKDRQNKRKNKPTVAKFDTKDTSKGIFNGKSIKYESILRESIEIDETFSEYDAYYVLNEFKNAQKGSKQNWGNLIEPSMYQKALSEFTKYGQLVKFPERYIYMWWGIIVRNTAILSANTELAGHSESYPIEVISNFLSDYLGDKFYGTDNTDVFIKLPEEEFIRLCNEKNIRESNGVHRNGQYDLFMNQEETDNYDERKENLLLDKKFMKYKEMAQQYNENCLNYYGLQTDKLDVDVNNHVIYRIKNVFNLLDDIGLYEWMVMPDGSDAVSDFGLEPICNILREYNDSKTPEEVLVLINRVLDIYHQRGDLSSIFIRGGSKTLSKISNGIVENKKRKVIIITESQKQKLREAADDDFSFEELSSIRSFKGRYDYCTKHIGRSIGRGSSRVIFQLSDEKVLKLALNNKGIAQNGEERRTYYKSIFPEVYDSDINDLWLVSEYVLPAKKQDFKECLGISFEEFVSFLLACGKYRFGRHYFFETMPYERWVELVENNEDLQEYDEYIGDYGHFIIGDMTQIANYGMTMRSGYPTIVLLDSGLSEEIYNNFYRRR